MSHFNRLPNEIRELINFEDFKVALEKHFWIRMTLHLDDIPESDREVD